MFTTSKLISDDRLLVDEYFSCTRVMYKRNVKAFTQLYCSRLRAQAEYVLADTSLEPGHTFE